MANTSERDGHDKSERWYPEGGGIISLSGITDLHPMVLALGGAGWSLQGAMLLGLPVLSTVI